MTDDTKKLVRKGDDYTTELFDIEAYLRDVWSAEALKNNPLAVDILDDLHTVFQNVPCGARQLDFGCGPTIMSILSSSRHCSHIVLSEFSKQFREAVLRWIEKNPAAHDWRPLMEYLAKKEGNGMTADDIDKRVRSAIKEVIPCNVFQDEPLSPASYEPFDLITSSLCLEAAAPDMKTYIDSLKKLAHLLKDDGLFVLDGVLNQNVYDVGKETFYSLYLGKDDIDKALAEAGFEPATWYIHQPESAKNMFTYEHDAAGWFVLYAKKKAH